MKFKPTLFLLFVAVLLLPGRSKAGGGNIFNRLKDAPAEPVLFIAQVEPNNVQGFYALSDVNKPAAFVNKIVVVTHGWLEKHTWPKDLAGAIQSRVDPNEWACCWYDWRAKANRLNPTDAAEYGKDSAGPLLGKAVLQFKNDWRHIHLIGHSAGAWVISEAAKTIAGQTKGSIHLTFLDAYVPPFWDQAELGGIANDPNVTYWAEHYLTRDITLGTTQKQLTHAHNVDITNADPGISDHQFAWNWYFGTVIGRYAENGKYEGKKLFSILGDTEYGFACGLEAGRSNWKASYALKLGNEPLKLKRPKKPLKLRLQELLKKHGK